MDTTELIALAAAVGALVPPATAIVEQSHFSNRTRTVIGVGLSMLAGFGTYAGVEGSFSSPVKVATFVLLVVGSSLVTYRNIYKPSGITAAIERKINPGPSAAPVVEDDPPDRAADDDGDEIELEAPPEIEDDPGNLPNDGTQEMRGGALRIVDER